MLGNPTLHIDRDILSKGHGMTLSRSKLDWRRAWQLRKVMLKCGVAYDLPGAVKGSTSTLQYDQQRSGEE
jgi:hypothetical protein